MCDDDSEFAEIKNNIEHAYDPCVEILPARIQQNKPHCPRCGATVTDIGTCPYCETKVNPRSYNKISGDINQVKFIETKIKPKYPVKPEKTKCEIVINMGKFRKKTVAFKKLVTFIWHPPRIFNFDVENHRQQGGPVIYQTYPRLKSELVEKEKALINKKQRFIYKIQTSKPCECGCRSNVIDHYHGQVLCPVCGRVHEKLFIMPGSDVE